jgi:hypothetical protein
LIVVRAKSVIAYSNEIDANSVVGPLVRHLLSINRRWEAVVRSARGSTEEEKVDAGHELQDLWIRSRERRAAPTLFGLPVVKHPQQASKGSGMENHQGRPDPDSRPRAEKFRASSS